MVSFVNALVHVSDVLLFSSIRSKTQQVAELRVEQSAAPGYVLDNLA